MDGCVVCCNGVDVVVYITGNDSQYSDSWVVVYSGGWFGVHDWCDILSVATDEVFTWCLAPVCNWWDGVFLFRSSVRMYFGFVKGARYVV